MILFNFNLILCEFIALLLLRTRKIAIFIVYT